MIHLGTTTSGAIFSECKQYRYALWRKLNDEPDADCVWIGLNPSTADESKLDNTTRRCLDWSQRWGCNRYVMLNAYAFRATKPRDMFAADDPIGIDNDRVIRDFCATAQIIVAAWGGNADDLRSVAVCNVVNRRLDCLGLNSDGTPKHPLYVPKATERILFWNPDTKGAGR